MYKLHPARSKKKKDESWAFPMIRIFSTRKIVSRSNHPMAIAAND
jgi:hypothetical protein